MMNPKRYPAKIQELLDIVGGTVHHKKVKTTLGLSYTCDAKYVMVFCRRRRRPCCPCPEEKYATPSQSITCFF